uniref:Uncharacterized protein n=1 Tax=Arundo donax TaxID=35708 RepID=A0A0A9H1P6_ARUDO
MTSHLSNSPVIANNLSE